MPELLWNILAILGLLCVLCTLLLGVWVAVSGELTVAVEWPEDDPTLDVQSHVGDSRPLR